MTWSFLVTMKYHHSSLVPACTSGEGVVRGFPIPDFQENSQYSRTMIKLYKYDRRDYLSWKGDNMKLVKQRIDTLITNT